MSTVLTLWHFGGGNRLGLGGGPDEGLVHLRVREAGSIVLGEVSCPRLAALEATIIHAEVVAFSFSQLRKTLLLATRGRAGLRGESQRGVLLSLIARRLLRAKVCLHFFLVAGPFSTSALIKFINLVLPIAIVGRLEDIFGDAEFTHFRASKGEDVVADSII